MARTAGPAREFVAGLLKANSDTSAADAVAAAKAKGIKLTKAYYYVLRGSLGVSRPQKAGRKGAPRTRRTAGSAKHAGNGADVMDQIRQQLGASHNYRSALEQIAKILQEVL